MTEDRIAYLDDIITHWRQTLPEDHKYYARVAQELLNEVRRLRAKLKEQENDRGK